MNISYHLMGSPKYWLAIPIVAPAMHITTETWNYLRHPWSEFYFPLKVSFFCQQCYKICCLFRTLPPLGPLCVHSEKPCFQSLTHLTYLTHIDASHSLIDLSLWSDRDSFCDHNSNAQTDNEIKTNGILLTLDHIWKQDMYLVIELEGPVVDVDVLKLEVVDEVLQHVRHPDVVPAAAPSAPPGAPLAAEVGLTKSSAPLAVRAQAEIRGRSDQFLPQASHLAQCSLACLWLRFCQKYFCLICVFKGCFWFEMWGFFSRCAQWD